MHSLLDEIKLNFPLQPIPQGVDAIIDTYMVEHLHEILGNKAWSTLTPTECRHCSDGFVFLTPIGLHYYLPAYLTAHIVDSKEADVVADGLIGLFQGARSFGNDKYLPFWQLVTQGQFDVIGRWIDHYESKYYYNKETKTEARNAREWVATFAKGGSAHQNGG